MKIKIYIEGGGDGANLDQRFREAWTTFFERAGLAGRMPRPVRGKGRKQTYDLYTQAVRTRRPDELPLLLVDSEDLVRSEHTPWAHLKARAADGWAKPEGAADDDAFLMICCMESWLIADRESLKTFFGREWRDRHLPAWPRLEDVEKSAVFNALAMASADCGSRRYEKGETSFKLLAAVDPEKVASACPSARRFLERLRSAR